MDQGLDQAVISAAASAPITQDEFQALEQKVFRAVEIVRKERDARVAAEAEAADLREKMQAERELAQLEREKAEALREQLDALKHASNSAQTQITTLNQERETVRLRVEKMLQQMDELL